MQLFPTPNPSVDAEVEILPQMLPSSATIALSIDFHITEIVFSNVTGSAVTVTVQDNQATPVVLFDAVSIAANSTYSLPFRGRWMPGGITWSASAANSISVSMRGF